MHISEINIYPVKSLKGISLNESLMEKRGLRYDRGWMLTDENDMFFTQREFPKMAAIGVSINGAGLRFSAEGLDDLAIDEEPTGKNVRRVTVWSSVCDAVAYGSEVNEWFSRALGTSCRLVRMPLETKRSINPLFNGGDDIVSFADGYPLMAIGKASLRDLNSRLETALPMNRFRPNVVISGSDAYAEDRWKRIRIGDTIFRSTKPCARCAVTTVDQARGDFDGKEPLRALAEYRKAKDVIPDRYESFGMGGNDVCFGQNLVPENPGSMLRLGDRIEVLDVY